MGERKSNRISGLSAVTDWLNGIILQESRENDPDFAKLRSLLQSECSDLVKLLNEAEIQVGNLPTRSMRAAAWLLFLQMGDHLETHVRAVQTTIGFLQAAGVQQFQLIFFYSSYLFQFKPTTKNVRISIHEGYISAPQEILQAVVKIGAGGRGKSHARDQIMAYAKSSAFLSVKGKLEQFNRAVYVDADARGEALHLKTAFDRVNWAYFEGKHSLPHLCWSGASNYRKLGHFNPVSDTIQVSSLLDRQETPEYVLDFIVYHELLHRELGVVEQNQRQMAHRSEFRHQEQDFAHYEAARQYLRKLVSPH